jgi:hypothetical protein
MVFPDERVAVVVLTNQDSVNASAAIARKIAPDPVVLFMDFRRHDRDAQLHRRRDARELSSGLARSVHLRSHKRTLRIGRCEACRVKQFVASTQWHV